eukprot:TRINITY_DN467_c0_g4_i1.p1 TRINITY_DN467_c0_g4~~TRINITY_DN467_c0_g4_i1.p1  ORF type:complete len:380 (+),score=82.92 TRINITY_DN467_c0_g4_i1:644-1783(+)
MTKPLTPTQIKENLNVAISASKSIGCVGINVIPDSIMQKRETVILGLVWQILRIYMLLQVNLRQTPSLVRLLKPDEEVAELLKINSEDLLLRWINFHLNNAKHTRKATNFGEDLKDAEIYTVILSQLGTADKSALSIGAEERAALAIEAATKLGAIPFTRPTQLLSGNSRVNLLFTASIFTALPGITATESELNQAAKLIDDEVDGSREERALRMWINSLSLEDVYVNNLYEDLRDGLVLLKIMDRINPGCVDWKKVDPNPTNKFKKIQNVNYVIEVGKSIKLTVVGIGGLDILDGNKKLTLALVWQLLRVHVLEILGGWSEEKLLEWANTISGDTKASSFKDSSIKTSRWLFNIIRGIEPAIINWDIVTAGDLSLIHI